jgi:hypothetical protein
VSARDGQEQRHPAVLETVGPPPARNKSSDPGSARYLHLPLDYRRIMAVVGAVGPEIRRIVDAFAGRIDTLPVPPLMAHLWVAVPAVLECQDLWCICCPNDAK